MESHKYDNELDSNLYFDIKTKLIKLYQHWQLIGFFVFTITFGAILISLLMPNQYKSVALLQPASPNASVEQKQSVVSLNFLGGSQIDPESQLALILVESRAFFNLLYQNDVFIAQMFAMKHIDKNVISYNSNIFDEENLKWIIEKPSFEVARNKFYEDHFSTELETAGFIQFSMIHQSPLIAKEWIDLVFSELNLYIKNEKIQEATLALNYLKNEINSTNVSELRKIFANGINQQTKILMLSEITDNFVFKYIDPPFVPVSRYSPMRTSIVLLTAVGSFMVICILLLIIESIGWSIRFNFIPWMLKIENHS